MEVLVAMAIAILITAQVFKVRQRQTHAENLQAALRKSVLETQSLHARHLASAPDAVVPETIKFNEQPWTYFPLAPPATGAFYFQPRPAP